jgi:hypothetical protein
VNTENEVRRNIRTVTASVQRALSGLGRPAEQPRASPELEGRNGYERASRSHLEATTGASMSEMWTDGGDDLLKRLLSRRKTGYSNFAKARREGL